MTNAPTVMPGQATETRPMAMARTPFQSREFESDLNMGYLLMCRWVEGRVIASGVGALLGFPRGVQIRLRPHVLDVRHFRRGANPRKPQGLHVGHKVSLVLPVQQAVRAVRPVAGSVWAQSCGRG